MVWTKIRPLETPPAGPKCKYYQGRVQKKSRFPRQEQFFGNLRKLQYFLMNFTPFEFSTSEMSIFPNEYYTFEFSTSDMSIFPTGISILLSYQLQKCSFSNISSGISSRLSSQPQKFRYFLWNFNTFEFSASEMRIFPLEFQYFWILNRRNANIPYTS